MGKLKVQAILRHRFTVDGSGITTLIGLYGCPLKCEYCLNKRILSTNKFKEMKPAELVDEVMIDYCYFVYTNGGITFGGGESLLHSKEIAEVREILNNNVKINIETSLNVDKQRLLDVIQFVDEYIIDIKGMNPEIYKKYTGLSNEHVLKNLQILVDNNLQHKCLIRIPNIKDYTTKSDIDESVKAIKQLGFENIDTFDYVIRS